MIFLITVLLSFAMIGCSDQDMAKNYGGTATVTIPSDRKFVNITWKNESDLWILTRPRQAGEKPETFAFTQEKGAIFSLTGNGTVNIVEQ